MVRASFRSRNWDRAAAQSAGKARRGATATRSDVLGLSGDVARPPRSGRDSDLVSTRPTEVPMCAVALARPQLSPTSDPERRDRAGARELERALLIRYH